MSGTGTIISNKALLIRDKLGLNDKFVILYHGDLSPNRGIQNVVAAVALSIAKIPDLVVLLALFVTHSSRLLFDFPGFRYSKLEKSQ